MVPFASLAEAEKALAAVGVPVRAHAERGLPHGIGPEGLDLALGFIRERLGLPS